MIHVGLFEHKGNAVTPQPISMLQGWNRSTVRLGRGLTRSEVSAHFMFWFALVMFLDTSTIMKRPNPLHPDRMNAQERRAELCSLLALGLARLHQRESRQNSDIYRESSLHNSARPSIHAVPSRKEAA